MRSLLQKAGFKSDRREKAVVQTTIFQMTNLPASSLLPERETPQL
jgi:hypothetical protein